MIKYLFALFVIPCFAFANIPYNGVELRVLNKITGVADNIIVRVDAPKQFQDLTIELQACFVSDSSDGSAKQSKAFLRVYENSTSKFSGWMFSTAREASFLDHQLFDIWVISCR